MDASASPARVGRRRRRSLVVGVGILAAGAIAVVWLGGPGPLVGALLGMNGPLAVHGEIVDAATGRPLDGVTLAIEASRFDPLGRDFTSSREWRETVSGRFSVACAVCGGLRIRATKPGHHGALVEAVYASDDEELRSGARRIELRSSAGAVPSLVPIGGDLRVGQDAEEVLPLGTRPTSHGVPRSRMAGYRESRAPGREEQVAWLVLRVARELDGQVREAVVERPGGSTGFRKPVEARLVVEGADGGFLAHRPRARRFQEIELEMSEAPAAGYAPELPLDVVTDRDTWFFLRVGDRFGRGRYGPPSIEHTSLGRRAAVGVRVWLSPAPGSRNLEALE